MGPLWRAIVTKAAPRPLPLFLDLLRQTAVRNPDLARRALAGVRIYGDIARIPRAERPVVHRIGRTRLVDGGGSSGPPVVLVPSLINPAYVLDLAPGNSLVDHLAANGLRPFLVDWGVPTEKDRGETIGDHVTHYLLPLLQQFDEPVHVVGYCLGGTMALAAANLTPVRSTSLLATPWHFTRYSEQARLAMAEFWTAHRGAIDAMGVMPIELLQSLFWSLDPDRTIAKYAALADWAPDDPRARGFAALEDWANSGAPLTAAAATELFDDLIDGDKCGTGVWRVGGTPVVATSLRMPCIHFTAHEDSIAPAETAPTGIRTISCPSGHVGMVVGKRARIGCWIPLTRWLLERP